MQNKVVRIFKRAKWFDKNFIIFKPQTIISYFIKRLKKDIVNCFLLYQIRLTSLVVFDLYKMELKTSGGIKNAFSLFYFLKHLTSSYYDLSFHVFFEFFKIVGLGYRLRRFLAGPKRSVKIALGFSHRIRHVLYNSVRIRLSRKKFFFLTNDVGLLHKVKHQILSYRPLNPYKLKGLVPRKVDFEMKLGKKNKKK